MGTITRKLGSSTAPGAVAGLVSQVGHLDQHKLWTPEELADGTIRASRFLVIVSSGAVHSRVLRREREPLPSSGALPHPASHAVLFTDRVLATDRS
jgi:hypothetical protein